MLLRSGVHVKTAPPAATPPWSCVWRNKDGLRCHVGRVYDPELFDDGATEYAQGQFPRKKPSSMTLIGGAVITNAPDYNMSQASSGGFKTGSVKIYYKTNFGRATFSDNDLQEVPESGYAYWPEGKFKSKNDGVYVILSRLEQTGEQSKWVISLSLEANIQKKDFKLACIAGTSCIQIWQSDITYATGGGGGGDHPWKVTCADSATKVEVSIADGSINNVMLDNPTYVHNITAEGEYSVLLKVTCVGLVYPEKVIWSVAKDWIPAENTLTECWLKAAHVKVEQAGDPATYTSTITQLFSSSLRSERLKHGNALNAARYYFNRL